MHIKGMRFGFPLVKRLGLLNHHETYRIAWNEHAGMEIHYVIKGDIAWELFHRRSPLAISGGHFGIIPDGCKHRALDEVGTPATRLGLILEQPAPELQTGTPFTADDLERMMARFRENGGCVRRFSRRLSSTLRDILRIISLDTVRDPDGRLQLRTLFTMLLHETYATLGEAEAIAEGHDVTPKIRKWIDTHYAEDISVKRLIKLSGYGRSRFFSLFFAETGMTPNDYLVRVRIEQAKLRLSDPATGPSLLDTAVACGFKSAGVFSTTFRKHVGMCPREFRAAARRSGGYLA